MNNNAEMSWLQLTCLKVGGAICLPVVMAGHALCKNFGLTSALVAIVVGNFVLLMLAIGMAHMSVDSRLTTTDNAKKYFGFYGTHFFAAALTIIYTSWVAIQLGLMSHSLKTLMPTTVSESYLIIVLGILVIAVSMKGITALTKLTSLIMPLLVATLAYAVYNVKTQETWNSSNLNLEGISLAIATAIAAIIDMPTYFKHSKTYFDSYLAAFLFIGIGVSIVEIVGVYLCYQNPGFTVMDTLQQKDTPIWNSWVICFIVLAGWSTNNSNLFSATAGLATIAPRLPEKYRTLSIGGIGILLALGNILHSFTFVIQLLGIAVVSMGSIIVIRYLLNKVSFLPNIPCHLNLFTWGLGACLGFASIYKLIEFSGAPLVDACAASILVSLITQLAIWSFQKRQSATKTEAQL